MKQVYLVVMLLVALLTPLAAAEVIMQPDGDVGKDTMVSSYTYEDNYGDEAELLLDHLG